MTTSVTHVTLASVKIKVRKGTDLIKFCDAADAHCENDTVIVDEALDVFANHEQGDKIKRKHFKQEFLANLQTLLGHPLTQQVVRADLSFLSNFFCIEVWFNLWEEKLLVGVLHAVANKGKVRYEKYSLSAPMIEDVYHMVITSQEG